MSSKIPVINGLRGIAMIGVMYHHFPSAVTQAGWHSFLLAGFPVFPLTLLSNAFQGVALFFFLSGLVLALPYAKGERRFGTWSDIWAFYRHRALRLLPLYYLSVILCLIFIEQPRTTDELLRSLFVFGTSTYTFGTGMFLPPMNVVLWTISLEIWFSLLFPWLMMAVQRVGIFGVAAGMVVTGYAAKTIGVLLVERRVLTLIEGTTNPAFDHLLCRLDDFGFGMLLAYLYVRHPALVTKHRAGLAGLVLILAGFLLRDYVSLRLLPLSAYPLSPLLLGLGFLLSVGWLLMHARSLIARVLSNRPLQMIGLMSYSLYIWHRVIMRPLHAGESDVRTLIYFVLLGILCFFSYRFVEFGRVKNVRELLPGKY